MQQYKEYSKDCKIKGAIFFIVFWGWYSEGFDFKYELARMVIIVGIPFSNITDPKLKGIKQFLSNKDNNTISFSDWLNYDAFV